MKHEMGIASSSSSTSSQTDQATLAPIQKPQIVVQSNSISHHRSFVFKYVLSCCAASIAETVTYPLDICKTRLQIQGELARAHATAGNTTCTPQYRGMVHTLFGIVQEEGVMKLFGGLRPAILRHFVYTGVRMSAYEYLRERVLLKNEDGTFPVWKAMIGGGLAGAIGQLFSSPADLIKVQMQMEGLRRLQGLPPRVDSMWHAFSSIVASGGVRQLWKGWLPNTQRAAIVNMADIATYDETKHFLIRRFGMADDMRLHGCASLCSGLAAAITSTPVDVVKTRIMNQDHNAPIYKGSLDCLIKTVQSEGFFALYKGFLPIYARMAPWSLTFWVSYEKIRNITGASSF